MACPLAMASNTETPQEAVVATDNTVRLGDEVAGAVEQVQPKDKAINSKKGNRRNVKKDNVRKRRPPPAASESSEEQDDMDDDEDGKIQKIRSHSGKVGDKSYNSHRTKKATVASQIQPRRTSVRDRAPSLKCVESILSGTGESGKLPPPERVRATRRDNSNPQVLSHALERAPSPMQFAAEQLRQAQAEEQRIAREAELRLALESRDASPVPGPSGDAEKPAGAENNSGDTSPYCETPSPVREAWFAEQEKKRQEEQAVDNRQNNTQQNQPEPYINILDDDDDSPLSVGGNDPMINGVGHNPNGNGYMSWPKNQGYMQY